MRLSILCSVDVNTVSWIHQHIDRLLNRLFKSATKTTSKLHIIMLLWGESTSGGLLTGGFPPQWASYAEIGFVSWRHHELSGVFIVQLPV